MASIVDSDRIAGVRLIVPEVFSDDRGFFVETFRRQWLPGCGHEMLQANRAQRSAGSLVGLHYHLHQADYFHLIVGRARLVLHDLRLGSPTDGNTLSVDMVAEEPLGVYIPPGVAHGFSALTDVVLTYLVDGYYNPADELGLAWDDPAVDADWGVTSPLLSERDRVNPRRGAIDPALMPHSGLRT